MFTVDCTPDRFDGLDFPDRVGAAKEAEGESGCLVVIQASQCHTSVHRVTLVTQGFPYSFVGGARGRGSMNNNQSGCKPQGSVLKKP